MAKPIPKESPEYILSLAWLDNLAMLLARYQGLGITSDIGNLNEQELFGVYRFLSRKGGESK